MDRNATPDGVQNKSQIEPNGVKNGAKMGPKVALGHPKVGPGVEFEMEPQIWCPKVDLGKKGSPKMGSTLECFFELIFADFLEPLFSFF